MVALLNADGEVAVRYEYDAWGNHVVTDKDGNPVTSGIGVLNPFRYRSYYYDTETELYYLQTRYYDPELGRFISQDSIEYAAPETINGLNLYAYCGNNPVMNIDPNGTWDWGVFSAVVTGVLSFASLVAGVVLTITGIGAPLGATLIGVGAGGLIGMFGNAVSQGLSNGWNNINWGQAAFNGVTGALIGGVMSSPAGSIVTAITIAGVSFSESVGNDLFESNFNWKEVGWGKATINALVMGAVSGAGKIFVNAGNTLSYGLDKFTQASFPAAKGIALLGGLTAMGAKFISAITRFIFKNIFKNIKW